MRGVGWASTRFGGRRFRCSWFRLRNDMMCGLFLLSTSSQRKQLRPGLNPSVHTIRPGRPCASLVFSCIPLVRILPLYCNAWSLSNQKEHGLHRRQEGERGLRPVPVPVGVPCTCFALQRSVDHMPCMPSGNTIIEVRVLSSSTSLPFTSS